MESISRIIEEFRSHKNIYAALIILHVAFLITNGFGTGFQNAPTEFETELVYGTPINQNVGQTINFSTSPPSSEIILVNQTPYLHEYNSFLPVRDIEEIKFNATIEVLSGTTDVYMWLSLFNNAGGAVSAIFRHEVPVGSTTITLTITKEMTQSISWGFVDSIYAGISPLENMLITNFCGKAKFSRGLCQVKVDIMSTDNVSVANFFPNGSGHVWPILILTQENSNYTSRYLPSPRLKYSPIFLVPGNYSGLISWYHDYAWTNTPIELEIQEGQSANWIIRIIAVRIDMIVEPHLTSYSIFITTQGDDIYYTWDIHASLPEAVYIPPVNMTIEISSSVSSQLANIHFPPVPGASIFVNGSYNLVYTLSYPYLLFQNIAFTPYQIALLLYLPALVYLVIARVVIAIEPSGPKQAWLNPRIIPVVAMLVIAATPWFFSAQTELEFFSHVNYSIFEAYFFPFFYQTTWADGSSAIAFSQVSLWNYSLPVIFFWIPLIYAASHIRLENSDSDIKISLALLAILLFGGVGWLMVSIESEPPCFPGPGLILTSLICLLWLIGLWWMNTKKKGKESSEN